MNRILREPLLHFLLLGAAIFAAYSLVSQRSGDEPGNIVISAGQVAAIELGFTRTWHRPPTRDELEGLIRDRVREEVYYREAMALGLDKDDTIIRRRLRQKMEFLTDDVVAQAQPTDAELNAYLTAHPDSFRVQREFTFSQVYLNPDKHGEHLARDSCGTARAVEPGRRQGRRLGVGRFIPARPHLRGRAGQLRSRNSLENSSRRSWARFRPANGKGQSSPVTASIWCLSATARKDACPRWMKCVTPWVANGPTPGGWQRTTTSTKKCSSATR